MTTKMPRLFAEQPPREPLTTIGAVVRDWTMRFGQGGRSAHMRDEVVEYCAAAPTLEVAVDRACASKRPSGKVHNHQSRVPHAVRSYFALKILSALHNNEPEYFDRLYDILDACKPPGIGPVTTYDVATRIAAYLRLPIESLYLHAGVKIGWELVYGKTNDVLIPRYSLPVELKVLPTDEIEDMLCAYRTVFEEWRR